MRREFTRSDYRPRRVLLVEANEDGTVGGSHQCLYDIATQLDRMVWDPVVLFYESNRFVVSLRENGIKVHVWDRERLVERQRWFHGGILGRATTVAKIPGAVLRRLRFLWRERIDLVHLNNSPCWGFDDWLPAARLARLPVISHARGPYVAPRSALAQWLMQRFDAVVAISRYIAADFERAGIPRDRIRQVYDGIALERWVRRPSDEGRKIRTRYGVPDDTMLVVLVGLLRFWKGQDVALVALLALDPEIRHRVRLWLVGSAPASDAEYADYLQRFVSEHGLTDIVQFLGFRTDVPEIMGAADVVLHASSVPEPFGLVVLEGLAQGKPVIASKLGGPSEILRPGEGLLFDPKRPEELARILTELVSSPETRRRLGECGHTRARDFDVRDNVKKVAHIWGQIMCR